MHDIEPFARAMLLACVAVLLAVGYYRVGDRLRVPAPLIFLLGASLAATFAPSLRELSVLSDQRIVSVALVVILFDGGAHIGWRRFAPQAGAIVWLGVAGTAVTAAGIALCAHGVFGFSWHTGLLLGAALAPTDPAVVFAVLGRREIEGRTGTLLEGESGANDPVGIALLLTLLEAGGSGWHALWGGLGRFGVEMIIGIVVGVVGGLLLREGLRVLRLPSPALYPIATLAAAGVLYGVATIGHGSGYLAVFIAGILIGDERGPAAEATRPVIGALGTLGEVVAFLVLGLTVSWSSLWDTGALGAGVGLGALLIVLIRPAALAGVLAPLALRRGERTFVAWAGLKGAVPILLGTFLITDHVAGASRGYGVIIVVVLLSVAVQGSTVPYAARITGVRMRLRGEGDTA